MPIAVSLSQRVSVRVSVYVHLHMVPTKNAGVRHVQCASACYAAVRG